MYKIKYHLLFFFFSPSLHINNLPIIENLIFRMYVQWAGNSDALQKKDAFRMHNKHVQVF